jgi:hypothetical protein
MSCHVLEDKRIVRIPIQRSANPVFLLFQWFSTFTLRRSDSSPLQGQASMATFKNKQKLTLKNGVFWDVTPLAVPRLLVTANVVPSPPILITLMMEGGDTFL